MLDVLADPAQVDDDYDEDDDQDHDSDLHKVVDAHTSGNGADQALRVTELHADAIESTSLAIHALTLPCHSIQGFGSLRSDLVHALVDLAQIIFSLSKGVCVRQNRSSSLY